MLKIVVATKNYNKLCEYKFLLRHLPVELIDLRDSGDINYPEETGKSYKENALAKARYAVKISGLPSIGDDSGIEVEALGGRPGINSARFSGPESNPTKNILKLLEEMKGVPPSKRAARFICVIAFVYPYKNVTGQFKEMFFNGIMDGFIAEKPEGSGGFGYDPIFISPLHNKTVAQLSIEEKAAISHRGIATRKLAKFIERNFLMWT